MAEESPIMPDDSTYHFTSFPDARYSARWRLLCWAPRGVLNDRLLDLVADFALMHEEVEMEPFHRFTDMSGLSEVRLKIGHIFDFANRRRHAALALNPVRSAIYSNTMVGLGIARLYESLMQDTDIHVRAFSSRVAAAEWLAVPLDVLVEHEASTTRDAGGFEHSQ